MEQTGSKHNFMGCLIKNLFILFFFLQQMMKGYIFLISFGLQETFIEREAKVI